MLLSPKVISFLLFGHQKGHSVILTDLKYSLLILREEDMGTKLIFFLNLFFFFFFFRSLIYG